MSAKSVQFTRELSATDFLDAHAFKNRMKRRYQAGKETDPWPQSRGFFLHYADTRAGGRVRHKFEVRTDSESDAQEAIDIAERVVPEASVWLSSNRQMATITWTE